MERTSGGCQLLIVRAGGRRAVREEQELRGGAHESGDPGEAVVHGDLGGGARTPVAHVARVAQIRRESRLDHELEAERHCLTRLVLRRTAAHQRSTNAREQRHENDIVGMRALELKTHTPRVRVAEVASDAVAPVARREVVAHGVRAARG